MLELDRTIKLTDSTHKELNLAKHFSEDDLRRIGSWVWTGYTTDLSSRAEWERRTNDATDLALQIVKQKTFPWPGASNVAFPLVTIATMQFSSRAYAALVNGPNIVKAKIFGADPTGKLNAVAQAVADHMSYQVLEEDENWEEQHDRLLITVPIVGTAFKKTFRDSRGINRSELVLARDLVLDYYAKSVEGCQRKTHVVPVYRNEMVERMATGLYIDELDAQWMKAPTLPYIPTFKGEEAYRTGQTQPPVDWSTPYTVLEQHCWMDLDGDGFAEPYIIEVELSQRKVLRIVARWGRAIDIQRTTTGRIFRIDSEEYFTKYGFIPSPDCSIYDIGFGVLLGPLNESVNTIINQLIDAGSLANAGGGFLGRGAKIRGGVYTFSPFEWKRVDATGDDLRKSIVPHDAREPSMVLFQLLGLLINYTERVSGSGDMMVGENPGQNTPAETTRTMVEQGGKIFGAIFKRTWRSMKWEFKKLFLLNATYMEGSTQYGAQGNSIGREAYMMDPERICPAADPNMTSTAMKLNQAQALKQAAMTTPGYDPVAVERKFLAAIEIPDPEVVYPGPEKFPPPKDPKMQIKEMELQARAQELQAEVQMFIAELSEEKRMNDAKILEIQAQLQLQAKNAQGDDGDRMVGQMNALVSILKARDDAITTRIKLANDRLKIQKDSQRAAPSRSDA